MDVTCLLIEPTPSWDPKNTRLLHFLRSNAGKDVKDFGAHRLFDLAPRHQYLGNATLAHNNAKINLPNAPHVCERNGFSQNCYGHGYPKRFNKNTHSGSIGIPKAGQ